VADNESHMNTIRNILAHNRLEPQSWQCVQYREQNRHGGTCVHSHRTAARVGAMESERASCEVRATGKRDQIDG